MPIEKKNHRYFCRVGKIIKKIFTYFLGKICLQFHFHLYKYEEVYIITKTFIFLNFTCSETVLLKVCSWSSVVLCPVIGLQ